MPNLGGKVELGLELLEEGGEEEGSEEEDDGPEEDVRDVGTMVAASWPNKLPTQPRTLLQHRPGEGQLRVVKINFMSMHEINVILLLKWKTSTRQITTIRRYHGRPHKHTHASRHA
jgi:hypothetical protein